MTRVALTLALTTLGGCAGRPAALDPAGPQAARIAGFWWLLLAVSIAVSVVVLAVLLDAALVLIQRQVTPWSRRSV